MIKPQFIVRSTSIRLLNQGIKFIWWPGVILAIFFLIIASSVFSAELKMAVIDTGFCPEKLKVPPQVKIEKFTDLTPGVKIDCSKGELEPLRFHGQLVLQEFLNNYTNKQELRIYPLVIFNERGDQKKEYWLSAIDFVKKNKIDFVLTAAGFITEERFLVELPGVWFVPSGREIPEVKGKVGLFPQYMAPKKNLFLIGDYYDGRQVLYDQALLYKTKIDYYFPAGAGKFKGTSKAVAEAAAKALNLCPLSTIRGCLKKASKEFYDGLSRTKIPTY